MPLLFAFLVSLKQVFYKFDKFYGLTGRFTKMKMLLCKYSIQKSFSDTSERCSSVGSVSSSYAKGPEIDPLVQHILLWKFFPSYADSRRASCQLLAIEWPLNTGKLPLGGLPRNSVIK